MLARPGLASQEEFVKICFKGLGFDSEYGRKFSCMIKYISIKVRLRFFENVSDSSTIYEANTLSEKAVNNIKQPEGMGHSSTTS